MSTIKFRSKVSQHKRLYTIQILLWFIECLFFKQTISVVIKLKGSAEHDKHLLTWFILRYIEQCSDIKRSICFIMEVVSRLVVNIGYKSVEFFMHIVCDLFWVHHPKGLKLTVKILSVTFATNFSLNDYRHDPKFSDRQVWVNSVDPDQTTPSGAL